MARKHLGSHSTEEDKVIFVLYFKMEPVVIPIAAVAAHHRPLFSPTLPSNTFIGHPVWLQELQQAVGGNPGNGGSAGPQGFDEQQAQQDFEILRRLVHGICGPIQELHRRGQSAIA
jgi:hypothetical protein